VSESKHKSKRSRIDVFDPGCIIPYYTGPLCRALQALHPDVRLISIGYHFDPQYFERNGLRPDPGCIDLIGRLGIRNRSFRRLLKSGEYCLNLSVLTLRMCARPPLVLHVQQLPFAGRGLPFESWFLSLARKLGVRLVHTVHDHLPHDTGERYRRTYERLYRMADKLICHTAQSKDRVAAEFAIDPRNIRVIPHGPLVLSAGSEESAAAVRSKLGISPQTCMVLCQGFIKPYKGVSFLLEAWQALHATGRDARLVIAGTGDPQLLRQLAAQAERLGINSTTHFEARFLTVEEVGAFYRAADVIVYPYKAITTSGALMTGLSYGKPIIATRLPAFEQTLCD
jgi:glycosyltransferase involved in cell wall biosynthesis